MRELRAALIGGALVMCGMAIGAIVFRSEPAGAQAGGYRECVFGRQESHDIDGQGRWERGDRNFDGDRIIRIPPGWEVAGSGGGDALTGIVMICRR